MNQKLVEENINLVYSVVNKYYPTFRQDEDIIQCGMLGLCQAADTWDESRGKFSTFAYTCIIYEIIREFHRRKKHKGVLSLELEKHDGDDAPVTLGDLLVGDEDVDYVDFDAFYDTLTPTQQKIVKYRLAGLNFNEISSKLGISKQASWNYKRKLKHAWRKVHGD